MKHVEISLSLLLVTSVHAGVLAGVLWPQQGEIDDRTPPRVEGVLIAAPPAERIMAPPVQEQPQPQPPDPIPKPEPKPEPKPKPRPVPVPVVEEPSERAIEVPETAPEPMPVLARTSEPVMPPRQDDRLAAPATSMDETAPLPDTIPPQPDMDPRNNSAPEYPIASRRMREEGTVLLELMVEADGSVSAIRVQTSSGFPRLDASAVKTVRRWRFIPAVRGGKPIAYRFVQPIEFALN